MKVACVIFTIVIAVVITTICVMVKFATDVTVEERRRNHIARTNVIYNPKRLSVVVLKDELKQCNRFPYLAAIMRDGATTWSFRCFGAVLKNWIITAARCVDTNSTHHVLVYEDFIENTTQTHPVSFWKVHEKYRANSLKYDIAIGRVDTYSGRICHVDDKYENIVDIGVWKSVFSMEMESYLTNEVIYYSHIIINNNCANEMMSGVDESIFCVDLSLYKDCFINEFGPVFANNKIVGLLQRKPRDCINKLAIFTNVSYYYEWIMQTMIYYL